MDHQNFFFQKLICPSCVVNSTGIQEVERFEGPNTTKIQAAFEKGPVMQSNIEKIEKQANAVVKVSTKTQLKIQFFQFFKDKNYEIDQLRVAANKATMLSYDELKKKSVEYNKKIEPLINVKMRFFV